MFNIVPMSTGSAETSPESLKRRRRIAEAMMSKGLDASEPVKSPIGGIDRVAKAWLGALLTTQMDQREKEQQAAAGKAFASMFGGVPAASAAPSAAAAPSMAGGGSSRAMAMPNVGDDVKTGIVQTANALGISPVDLATAISYETGGTFNPTQAGPTTKWGQHRGLIQFGEPQARQHGVDWSNPVASQLGPNGAVASYLRSAGVKPGMGMLDIYSAINAGGVGRYGASDAAAGGAPGTVADKVNNQMSGHRAKALALFPDVAQADLPAPGAVPVAMDTRQQGFAVPEAPVQSIAGDDPVKLRADAEYYAQTNPEAARQFLARAAQAEAAAQAAQSTPAPEAAPAPIAQPETPPMDQQTFNAIAAAAGSGGAGDIVRPVFDFEGVSQPWMGTALAPQAPADPQMVQAPLPPSRPSDLPADLPAPGAVPAIGRMPETVAAPMPDLSNTNDAGSRTFAAMEAARSADPRAGIVNAMMGAPQQAAAAPSPAVQQVANAVAASQGVPAATQAAQASPAGSLTAQQQAAITVMNNPYSTPGQLQIAQTVLSQAYRDPTKVEMDRLQLEKARGEAELAPLDRQSRELDIKTKEKNLGKVEAPNVQRIKQPDGSEVAVQWDAVNGRYIPLVAPEGGNAVRAPSKLTEQQSKDVGFYNRGSKIVDRLDSQDMALLDGLSAAGGSVSNFLKSDAYRNAEQTGRELLAVILRKDTGAAVTPQEMEQYGSIYLPRPGDDKATIEQKRASRRTAIEGLKMGLGPADILFNSQNAKAPSQAAPDRAALEAEARRRGLIK